MVAMGVFIPVVVTLDATWYSGVVQAGAGGGQLAPRREGQFVRKRRIRLEAGGRLTQWKRVQVALAQMDAMIQALRNENLTPQPQQQHSCLLQKVALHSV